MKWMEKLNENIKKTVRSWLNVTPANPYNFQINDRDVEFMVDKADVDEFGGVCVGTFATYDTLNLTTRSGKQLTTRSGKHITIWREK